MGAFKVAMDVYIAYKFGVLLPSTSVVNAVQSAFQLIHLRDYVHQGDGTFVFRYYSLGGDTAMPGGLYAMHF